MPIDPLLTGLPVGGAGLLPLLEVAHAAHRLGFSQEQVRRLIRTGALPAIRIGKRWRIDPHDLVAFIEAHRVRLPRERGPRWDAAAAS